MVFYLISITFSLGLARISPPLPPPPPPLIFKEFTHEKFFMYDIPLHKYYITKFFFPFFF